MSDHQDLRKLLIEARDYMGHRSACQGSLCPVCNLRVRISAALAEPVEPAAGKWIAGAPPKPWCNEWFIAKTTFGDRVVLKALPEEYTYDFKTADDTYTKADKIVCWMQFPDSQYIAAPADQDRVDAERYRAVRKKDFEEAKNHHFNFTGYPFERSEHDYNKEYDLIADRARSAK